MPAAARVFPLYALSGFVSLGYQVAWFRIFTDHFGSTNLTFALVVVNFIGGLGAGALVSRAVSDLVARRLRLTDRLRVYGAVELLVGATVLLTVLFQRIPPDALGSFPYVLREGIYQPELWHQLAQVGMGVVCVFVPCFFMGVTFPLLCHAFLGTPRAGRFPSTLYAWNTLGACLGVLACQFLLLPWIGHDRTFLLMAAANLLLGGYFLATGGAPGAAPAPEPELPRAARAEGTTILVTCAVLSGLVAGALEGDAFKRIGWNAASSSATMSMISFWVILAIFLASTAVRLLPRLTLTHIKIAFVLALALYVATWGQALAIVEWFTRQTAEGPATLVSAAPGSGTEPVYFPASLGQLLAFVGISIFPTFLLTSLLLPYVCNRIQADRRHLGLAYGLNTLAFCLGLVAFTLVAPRVDVFYSLKLFLVLLAVSVAFLLTISEGRRLAPWKPALALVAFGAGCVATPSGFDASFVSPDRLSARFPVHSMRSNAAHTTYVVDVPGDRRLFFDNYSMSGSSIGAQFYMRTMAHFPLLAHPGPRQALLICFGVGNTASAIAAHETIERIDVVDLNDQVFTTAPAFAGENGSVHLDPRIRFIHADGRSHLARSDQRYDLITSEPPPPMHTGVYRLYSEEYYRDALAHLSEAGMMTQWLPARQMSPAAIDLSISTFVEVFPHVLLFSGFDTEFILLGSRSPIDLRVLERRFAEADAARADLARLGIDTALSLVARVVRSDASLRAEWAGRRTLSDQHNDLEHEFIERLHGHVPRYDPARLFGEIGAGRLEMAAELRAVLMHLGRLHYHAAGMPPELLMSAREAEGERPKLAEIDWNAVRRQLQAAQAAARKGNADRATRRYRQGLLHSQELPRLQLGFAASLLRQGRSEEAVGALERFVALEPRESIGHHYLGMARIQAGRPNQALAPLREAVRLAPDSPEPIALLAWTLATDPRVAGADFGEAVALGERAAALTAQRDPRVLDVLSTTYAAAGRFDRAIATSERAIARATELGNEPSAEAARGRLALYREGKPYRAHTASSR